MSAIKSNIPDNSPIETRVSRLEDNLNVLAREVNQLTQIQIDLGKTVTRHAEETSNSISSLKTEMVRIVGEVARDIEKTSYQASEKIEQKTRPDWNLIMGALVVIIAIVTFVMNRYDSAMAEIATVQKDLSVYNINDQYDKGRNDGYTELILQRSRLNEDVLNKIRDRAEEWRIEVAERLGFLEVYPFKRFTGGSSSSSSSSDKSRKYSKNARVRSETPLDRAEEGMSLKRGKKGH